MAVASSGVISGLPWTRLCPTRITMRATHLPPIPANTLSLMVTNMLIHCPLTTVWVWSQRSQWGQIRRDQWSLQMQSVDLLCVLWRLSRECARRCCEVIEDWGSLDVLQTLDPVLSFPRSSIINCSQLQSRLELLRHRSTVERWRFVAKSKSHNTKTYCSSLRKQYTQTQPSLSLEPSHGLLLWESHVSCSHTHCTQWSVIIMSGKNTVAGQLWWVSK